MRAIIYSRVSSDRQKEGESLETQLTMAQAYCEKRGWVIAETLVDVISGQSRKRPKWHTLQERIAARACDVVIFYRFDRAARSREFFKFWDLCEEYRTSFLSLTQEMINTTTPEGRLFLMQMVAFSIFEVEQLGRRVKDNLMHIASRGGATGGPCPYGYRYTPHIRDTRGSVIEQGYYEVDPLEAEGVRLAYRVYLDRGTEAAAKALNTAGYRTRLGNPWNSLTIRKLVLNAFYAGMKPWGKQPVVSAKRQLSFHEAHNNISEWMAFPSDHPAIIDLETYNAALRRFLEYRQVPSVARYGEYPWSGFMVCGSCGGRLTYISKAGSGARYGCKHQRVGACEGVTSIGSAWLDGWVLPRIAEAVDASQFAKTSTTRRKSKEVKAVPIEQAQIAKIKGQISKLDWRFAEDLIEPDDYKRERKDLMTRLQSFEVRLAEGSTPSSSPVAPPRIEGRFLDLWKGLEGADRRTLIRLFVEGIEVSSEAVTVRLKQYVGLDLEPEIVIERNARSRLKGRWSSYSDACLVCGTTTIKHRAQGLCRNCDSRKKWRQWRKPKVSDSPST